MDILYYFGEYKGISRVLLSKSNEPISTRSSILVCITFPLFLTSLVCIIWYDAVRATGVEDSRRFLS